MTTAKMGNLDGPVLDFKALPKIELHAHLSGSISRQCLHEIWLMKKAAAGGTTLQDPLIEMPLGKHDYDLKTFFPLFSSYIYNLVDDAAALRHATLSVLRDFAADGVVYLELRTTPRALPRAGLDAAGYVDAILAALAEYERAQADAPEPKLRTRLILSIDRRATPSLAAHTLALCVPPRIVGIDLCGDPSVPLAAHLTPVFLAARRTPGLGMTVHFAEAECSASPEELATLLAWRPDRLGHVIGVGEEVKGEIVERGGVGLELCLSCNVQAGMVEGGFAGHHFGEWWKVDETVVVLSTDDVGVFGSPLSNEYALVAEHFGLGRAEICALVRKGIDVIFGGEEEKARLRKILWEA